MVPCQAHFVQESPKTFFFLSPNQNEKKIPVHVQKRRQSYAKVTKPL